ncbi:MAG: ThiF family adenylyltransferase [Anaerolineae bacterium]|nr:ThiF family adenylyltransferase [Anaerolineae bacterium]NUQ03359.1 ThiF family adenylyltransferase [Anaerolineae bacterium]
MTWDRVERLIGSENLARLATRRVGVIGLGSGGSFVAVSLAMSGVKHFALIDPDVLEETNIPRHAADRRYLGWNKAEAVADLIRARVVDTDIAVFPGKFEDHPEAFAGLDLLIVAVDNENAKYRINQRCLESRLTAVYAGVYERGEGGDVVIIHPYDGPCYACWAEELRAGAAPGDDDAELDYGMIGKAGTLEAEPGLWLHVVRVASAQADMALNELLRGTAVHRPLPGNTVVMANTAMEIVPGELTLPYAAEWFAIDRSPGCMVCGLEEADADLSLDELLSAQGGTGAVQES